MSAPTRDADALRTHVARLRYAVETTDCRETRAMLKSLLGEAEARLRSSLQTGAAA